MNIILKGHELIIATEAFVGRSLMGGSFDDQRKLFDKISKARIKKTGLALDSLSDNELLLLYIGIVVRFKTTYGDVPLLNTIEDYLRSNGKADVITAINTVTKEHN